MKKLLSILLTLVMALCLVNLNNNQAKADGESNDLSTPFTITALEDGTTVRLIFTKSEGSSYVPNALEISKDDGVTWTSYTYDTEEIQLSKDQSVLIRAKANGRLSQDKNNYVSVISDKDISASGNIMSLIYKSDEFASATTIPSGYTYCFNGLFDGNTHLKSIDNLKLPATTLTDYCYKQLFYGCNGLTSIPEQLLPAITLAQNCYQAMFAECTELTSLPENLLPATNLARGCYYYMFYGCSNITNVPNLPATKLAEDCYNVMFQNCTNLSNGMREQKTGNYTVEFSIPSNGTVEECPTGEYVGVAEDMFKDVNGFVNVTPDFAVGNKITYYKKSATPEPEPSPSPSEPVVKDESCEKVIGPSWHWNNTKGVCEEYATVGTATR